MAIVAAIIILIVALILGTILIINQTKYSNKRFCIFIFLNKWIMRLCTW